MQKVADNIYTLEAGLRFFGLPIDTRMTVINTADGVLVHSPVKAPVDILAGIGELRWAVAPNKFHHLYVGDWIDAGAEGWAAPGLPDKRKDLTFTGVLNEVGEPFGDEILAIPLTCFPMSNEVVLFHKPSRTLVVTDLVFNLSKQAKFSARAAFAMAGAYPGCKTSNLERILMKRDLARQDFETILAQEFDRIIMSHGDIVETGGKDALKHAFRWLL